MAVYTVRTRDVFVLGKGWYGQAMAYPYTLPKGIPATRDAIQDWLGSNSGDFQFITDFAASIEETEIPWAKEENDFLYNDMIDPVEVE